MQRVVACAKRGMFLRSPSYRSVVSRPAVLRCQPESRRTVVPDYQHPLSVPDFRKRAHEMIDYICDYYEGLESRPVRSQVKEGYLEKVLPSSAPRKADSFEEVMADVDKHIMPGITHWQSPNFFAYFPANSSFPAMLAESLSSALNVIAFSWVASPAATELEIIVLDWLVELCGLPDAFSSKSDLGGGVLQPTASEASLVAILGARERALTQHPGAEALLVAYSSDQAHFAFQKGARIAGIKNVRLLPVTSDDDYALRADVLQSAIDEDIAAGLVPFFVNLSVGTTSSAAVDPLAELATVGRAVGAWVHVDAAYAGSAAICPELRPAFTGLELVDSYDFNPHKWLLTNFDCSAMFFRDATYIQRALSISAAYFSKGEGNIIDLKDMQIPLGRRFKALKLWFVLRLYGQANLQAFIRHHMQLADYFVELVTADGALELAATPRFALVCFRMKDADNDAHLRLLEGINASGQAFLTHTTLDGKVALRLALGGALTQQRHVDQAWRCITEEVAALSRVAV